MPPSSTRIQSYLVIASVFAWWDIVFYAALIVYGSYIMTIQGRADDAVLTALIVAPILAGTGLLTTAREGRLDLLFGCGAGRAGVWFTAFVRVVLLPLSGISLCAGWWLRAATGNALSAGVRTFGAGAITMSIAFAIGMLRPRYLAGVAWAGLRVAFLLSAVGRGIYMQVVHPDQVGAPTLVRSIIGVVGFPEVLLHATVSPAALAMLLTLGVAALALSFRIFLRADFGGHRTI